MSSGAYLELLKSWFSSKHLEDDTPELPTMVATSVTTALANIERHAARNLLEHIITFRSEFVPDDQRAILRRTHAAEIRSRAWGAYGTNAPLTEWEAAAVTEADADVRAAMRLRAPWAELSDTAVWALLETKTKRMTRAAARLLVDTKFRPGMEDLWREAITHLPADKVPTHVRSAAVHPVVWGDLAGLSEDSDLFYLLAQACAPNAPDGTLTALVDRHGQPEVMRLLGEDTSMTRPWLEAVLRVNVNRNTDVALVLDHLWSAVASKSFTFTEQASLALDLHVQLQARVLCEQTNNANGRELRHLLPNWHRLPVEHRSDLVCADFLHYGASDLELCDVVLSHLGARAHEVLTAAGLLDLNHKAWRNRTPDWWRLVDRELWASAYRCGRHPATDTNRLEHVPEDDVQALVDDLLARPHEWVKTAVYALSLSVEFSPEEWLQLPPGHLEHLMNREPRLFHWLPGLVSDDDLQSPAAAHALATVADNDVSLAEALTVTRALA